MSRHICNLMKSPKLGLQIKKIRRLTKRFFPSIGHVIRALIKEFGVHLHLKIIDLYKMSQSSRKAFRHILSKLCNYPENNFVPVFWMASEDHDFAEIASFNLFGKTHRWEGDHSGAVGKLNPKEFAFLRFFLALYQISCS